MIDVEHLLELAQEEATSKGKGAPRQAKLRRAVSTAYYAVFHELSGSLASTFVPAHSFKARAVFYRALGHGETKTRCEDATKTTLPSKISKRLGIQYFSKEIVVFARIFVTLQGLRHECDYDPDFSISSEEAIDAIEDARVAVKALRKSDEKTRLLFFAFLLNGLRA